MDRFTGGCLCGDVRIVAIGRPYRVGLCHCLDCRKHHGALFAASAIFPKAAVHDHWAIYRGTDWEDSECDGRVLAPSVVRARTPGHTAQDLATIVGTPDGVVVLTHSWFNADTTVDDETPDDAAELHASRAAILEIADVIVPGHGPMFRPTEATPR